MKRVLFLFFLLLSLSFSYELKGCGGTFAGEVMKDLSDSFYETSKNKVEYLAIGSSGGLKKVMNNDCDFAILELETTGEELERVPFLKGAVVLAYNLDNVSSLILSREIIAKIYMGKITKWNDEEILALNKDLSLPDKKINLFHRYDGSGTTLNFSKYLSESKAWKNGVSEYINFKYGIGKRGNLELAQSIKSTSNSLGYIGYPFAKKLNLNYALLKDENGEILTPNDTNYPLQNSSFLVYKKSKEDKLNDFISFIEINGSEIIIKNNLIP